MDLVDSNLSELKNERQELMALWQKFVPGLVSFPQSASGLPASSANTQSDGSATGHKILVEPSVFNIGSLLPPSVSFLKRLRDVVPPGSDIVISSLTSCINEFLINVFHPQLEETLTDYCSQIFTQPDAFQRDSQWEQYAQKPIFKVGLRLILRSNHRLSTIIGHNKIL